MSLSVEQNILRLHVAVDDIPLVEVLDGQDQLRDVEAGLELLEGHFASEMVAEVLPRAVVQGQVQEVRGLESIVQVYYKRVVGFLQHVRFRNRVLELLFDDQRLFLQGLQSIHLIARYVPSQKYLPKCSGPESLDNIKGGETGL